MITLGLWCTWSSLLQEVKACLLFDKAKGTELKQLNNASLPVTIVQVVCKVVSVSYRLDFQPVSWYLSSP